MQPAVRKARASSREAILAATEKLMAEEGYAAVSTRRVAKMVGVAPALVHYHFATTEDLLMALFRKLTEASRAETIAALAGPDPLKALWALNSDPGATVIIHEFMALSNHRKEIRAEIAAYVEEMRVIQAEALAASSSAATGGDARQFGAMGLSVLVAGMARSLVMEGGMGVTLGHEEAQKIITVLIDAVREGKVTLS
ncbi:MAG TPA: TetR/AcrR family transcriptional regulator [Sphingobium sp.]|uniref:TetR/AcrR family transcriptional regulator n=1 Tax=Sphingobium sp. TaxID=1912891 RepID=UPI002ED24E3E